MKSRTQGSRPRPRTQKKSEAKAKDSLSEDRPSRGQGQECSRPRPRTKDTSASALQGKKIKVFTKIFQAISKKKQGLHKNFSGDLHKKNVFQKNFSSASQNFNNSKNRVVLEPKTGQFSRTSGLEAKAKDFKMCPRQLEIGGNIGRVDRASAAETVDWSSIPGRVKPKTIKIGIHKLPFLTFSN